jgi:hypothetical protein
VWICISYALFKNYLNFLCAYHWNYGENTQSSLSLSLSIYIYIYIYIFTLLGYCAALAGSMLTFRDVSFASSRVKKSTMALWPLWWDWYMILKCRKNYQPTPLNIQEERKFNYIAGGCRRSSQHIWYYLIMVEDVHWNWTWKNSYVSSYNIPSFPLFFCYI